MISKDWESFFDNVMTEIYTEKSLDHILIVVLYECDEHPLYCDHMPLDPEPEVNIPAIEFQTIYKEALLTNDAVKDGAVMIKLPKKDNEYPILTGWSYRLFAPPIDVERRVNRGSGYNSSLDFSVIDGVSSVYLVNHKGALRFEKGVETVLAPIQNEVSDD